MQHPLIDIPLDDHGNFARLEDVLAYWAQRQPRSKAYTELDAQGGEVDSITYGELDRRARLLGRKLAVALPAGSHVALAYPAGVEFTVAFFACMHAGLTAAAVPLPRDKRPNARLAQMIRAADMELVLTSRSIHAWFVGLLEREPDWPAGLPIVATEGLDAESEAAPLFTQPPAAFDAQRRAERQDHGERGDGSVAFAQFTSGSTSLPKGVLLTHRACLYNLEMIRHVSHATNESVHVTWLPHYHDLGLVAHLLHSVYCGSHCVILSPATFVAQPVQWLRAISRYKAQYSGAPNFAFQLCLDRVSPGERETLDLSSLRMVINAAEPIDPQTLRAFSEGFAASGFPSTAMLPAYGMAEATVCITGTPLGRGPRTRRLDPQALYTEGRARDAAPDRPARELVACGYTRLEQEIRIVDAQQGRSLPPDEVGEIWIRGANMMTGYYRNPEATAATLGRLGDDPRPWLRTGDLGFLDANGEVFITGRAKDVIIVNGANYFPQDIEECAQLAHPALRRGGLAAIGGRHAGAEAVVILAEIEKDAIERAAQAPASLEEVAASICAAIGEHFELPVARIAFLAPYQLPKTSSGKIRRQECRQRDAAGHPDSVAVWPFNRPSANDPHSDSPTERTVPMSHVEKALARMTEKGPEHLRVFSLLTQILSADHGVQLNDLDIDKSIFFYGIDSLNIIGIHAKLEEKLKASIPTVAFFRANSFADMVDDIVASITDRARFDQAMGESSTLREEIDQAVERLSSKLAAVPDRSDGSLGKRTLLTGASGFVGVALLKEILERSDAEVVCMVRAADETAALKRIRHTSAKYALRLPQGFEKRVKIMLGDMSKPWLGLTEDEYRRHQRDIDSVVHCAAIDNFYLPYSIMRKTNVLGTLEMLEFALGGKLKPMFYISSCAVSMLEGNDVHTAVVGLVNGYAQSKYVSEQIVLGLAERGYPAVNYRLGYLYNLRVQEVPDGMPFDKLLAAVEKAYDELGEELIIDADAFENFLSSLPKIGALPDMDCDFDLTPVEYAAKAIVSSALLPPAQRQTTYTFYNPEPLKWRDVISYFRKAHPKVELLPLPAFLERYDQYIRETTKVSAKLLKSVVSRELENQFNTMFRQVEPDVWPAFKAWCPPCDTRFTHYYTDFAVNG